MLVSVNAPSGSRRGRRVGIAEWLDIIMYGGLAAAAIGYVCFLAAREVWASGSWWLVGGMVAIGLGTAIALIRDLARRRLGWVSRIVLGVWLAAAGLIVLLELFDM